MLEILEEDSESVLPRTGLHRFGGSDFFFWPSFLMICFWKTIAAWRMIASVSNEGYCHRIQLLVGSGLEECYLVSAIALTSAGWGLSGHLPSFRIFNDAGEKILRRTRDGT